MDVGRRKTVERKFLDGQKSKDESRKFVDGNQQRDVRGHSAVERL
jgi:hypothetical protein